MRNMHGSMMDAAGARPEDWARALLRWTAAVVPDAEHPKKVPLPLMPAARSLAAQSLFARAASSQSVQALQTASALPGLALDAGATREALSLGGAVMEQWMTLQAQWLDALTVWAQRAAEMRQPNTVSKFVDQEMNLAQQGFALVSGQATATVRLLENIQVDLAWWLSRRATADA